MCIPFQYDGERTEIPLSIENTMWANTVIASGLSHKFSFLFKENKIFFLCHCRWL